jgi:mRNA-degrading endonuclease toxin of MazEF toxin-antitoxin module
MRRGEVWTVRDPGSQTRRRGVIVSTDKHNVKPGAVPTLVPIVRHSRGDLPSEYVTSLGEMDPIAGVAVISRLAWVDPSRATDKVGMLTGATMDVIGAALRDFYEVN